MKKFFLLLGAAFVLLIGFTVALTARYESPQPPARLLPDVAIPEGAAERLAGSLRIPTISSEDPAAFNAEAFGALHEYLEAAFPRVHAQLRRETVGVHSLLYTWQGSDSSLNPILLIGHMDVVPVEPGTQVVGNQRGLHKDPGIADALRQSFDAGVTTPPRDGHPKTRNDICQRQRRNGCE